MLLGEQVVLFRDKGVVAQIGTPAELVNHPASDFVADFVGSEMCIRDRHDPLARALRDPARDPQHPGAR
ncbi:MAG: hypothetical protein ACSLE3_11260, partial [Microbacteriaceae bacterium]